MWWKQSIDSDKAGEKMELDLQDFLFGRTPSRRELLNYGPRAQTDCCRVQVFRNHSFELAADTMGAYLDYAGLSVSFSYSDYDDSFSFLSLDRTADLVLIWIDMTRYRSIDPEAFLKERVMQLKSQFRRPILVIPFGQPVMISETGVAVWNLTPVQKELGDRYTDDRAKELTGTPLSGRAMQLISRWLGLRCLPSLLKPRLKAIVTDLDNTLYSGVLGEDGVEGVVLTEGHRELQRKLKALAQSGIFLCAASKNEAADVDALFEGREDFPLKKDDFTWICASWEPKAQMISEILSRLHIGADSTLFVDDNIGELESVHAVYPQLHRIHANDDASVTSEVLDWFPGCYCGGISVENSIRKGDIQANQERQRLAAGASPEEYIRSLRMRLTYVINDRAHLARISELANKTNQFIFNYRRYTPAEVEEMLRDDSCRMVTVSLSDRLSDSGLIGVCVGKDRGGYVEVEECFISCRALGRGIDDIIVLGAIQVLTETFGKCAVKIQFQSGARNEPARRFVQERLSTYLDQPREFCYQIPGNLLDWKVTEG